MVLTGTVTVPAQAGVPDPVAPSAILVDGQSGQVLWARNPDQGMYPASITKILTALLAIEKGNLDAQVTVPEEAQGVEGTSIGLAAGEVFTLKNLLYCLLLDSANDSAVTIADYIGGSVPNFVRMMNAKARSLGAVDCHFTNPDGLFNSDHYVTARDMAIITRAAMQNPVFRSIVATRYYTLPPRVNPKAQVDLVNHNHMLWTYPGCIGVKEGYIVKSGETLVVAADRNGRELIAVVLDSRPDSLWSDGKSLLDYGFNHFCRRQVVVRGQAVTSAPVRSGTAGAVSLVTAQPVYYDFPVNAAMDVQRRIEVDSTVTAPVRRGESLGVMVLSADGTDIARVPLVAGRAVPRKPYDQWVFWLIGTPVVAGVLFLPAYRQRVKRRRLERLPYRLRHR